MFRVDFNNSTLKINVIEALCVMHKAIFNTVKIFLPKSTEEHVSPLKRCISPKLLT